MTRDEAIKDFGACIWPGSASGPDLAVRYVDWFAKNGMLKLDEPKSVQGKFTDLYLRLGCASEVGADCFQAHLNSVGLKIVEK